ncbi:MAG: hypothetical protein M1499_09315 [Firmicutes bacterium]|nr:hypothetical protein [Bacillota bacterium]
MSTPSDLARNHKGGMHLSPSQEKPKAKKHYFRNTLLILIILAALVMWQLNPVIAGLGTLQHGLRHAESTRALLASILSAIFAKIHHWIMPLLAHL